MEAIYILYKTTCLITGKFYIGVHRCTDLNDGYLGSGHVIKAAIKKYGRESFRREIIQTYSSAEEAYSAESRLVTEQFLEDPMVMNLGLGGRGGILALDQIEKIRIAMREFKHSAKTKEKLSRDRIGEKNPFFGKKLDNTHIAALREGHRKKMQKAVTIDGITYPSCRDAAEALNISPSTISSWIKNGKAIKHVGSP
jgi:group I intron endonuclease